jgi:hypothetical protein
MYAEGRASAKISAALPSCDSANGSRVRHESESLAADSCDLGPRRPPGAPFSRFAAKIFCLGESVPAPALPTAKAHRCEPGRNTREHEHKTIARKENPQFIGISAACAKLTANARATKNLLEADFTECRPALMRQRRGAALTHKIKWSHCYFFPAVVIRMTVHVDSRLHCTDVAIHSG